MSCCVNGAEEGAASLAAAAAAATSRAAAPPTADTPYESQPHMHQAILHVDVDCFYCQVELVRDPTIDRERPVAVSQKFLVVTANYAARAAGVGKLMRIDAAKECCPELVLIPGEDLTPYREASAAIFTVLSEFGACQKLGLDEFFVDVTIASKLLGTKLPWAAACHVHAAKHGTSSAEALEGRTTNMRPQDLRAKAASTSDSGGGDGGGAGRVCKGATAVADDCDDDNDGDTLTTLLRAASHVAEHCKRAVLEQCGLTVSAGVASTKALAKLVSGLHKPDGLSALPQSQAIAFLAPLDCRVLPGVGSALVPALSRLGVRTIGELARIPEAELHRALMACKGSRATPTITPRKLLDLANGRAREAVVPSGPPKSLSVEDSFKGATTFDALELVLRVLAPDLVRRLVTDRRAHRRRPRTLTVRYRHAGARTMNVPHGQLSGASFVRSTPMPHLHADAPTGSGAVDADGKAAATLVRAALAVLRDALSERRGQFCLTLVGIGATNFEPAALSGRGTRSSSEATSSAATSILSNSASSSSSSSSLLSAAAAAAEAQRNWRADYGFVRSNGASSGGTALVAPLSSKLEERRKREAATAAALIARRHGGGGQQRVDAAPEASGGGGARFEDDDDDRDHLSDDLGVGAAPNHGSSLGPAIEMADEFGHDDEDESLCWPVSDAEELHSQDEEENAEHERELPEVAAEANGASMIDSKSLAEHLPARCPICSADISALDNVAQNAHMDACLGQTEPTPRRSATSAVGVKVASGGKRKSGNATGSSAEEGRRLKQQRALMASWMTGGR